MRLRSRAALPALGAARSSLRRSRVRGGSRSALTGAACASLAPPRCRRRCRLHESGAVFTNPPSVDRAGNEVELRLVTSVASVPASGRGRGRNSRGTGYDLLAGRCKPPSREALSSGGLELHRAGAPSPADHASALGAAPPAHRRGRGCRRGAAPSRSRSPPPCSAPCLHSSAPARFPVSHRPREETAPTNAQSVARNCWKPLPFACALCLSSLRKLGYMQMQMDIAAGHSVRFRMDTCNSGIAYDSLRSVAELEREN
jgi:hypothetical protein